MPGGGIRRIVKCHSIRKALSFFFSFSLSLSFPFTSRFLRLLFLHFIVLFTHADTTWSTQAPSRAYTYKSANMYVQDPRPVTVREPRKPRLVSSSFRSSCFLISYPPIILASQIFRHKISTLCFKITRNKFPTLAASISR